MQIKCCVDLEMSVDGCWMMLDDIAELPHKFNGARAANCRNKVELE